MKHRTTKLLALVLSAAMIFSLFSALTHVSATETDLRNVVVKEMQDIMDVEYTLQTRIARANVTGDHLDAFHAGGILPTTYFEYERMYFPVRGVVVESNAASLEYFKSQISMADSQKAGVGNINKSKPRGMDMNALLVDLISRVSPAKVTSIRQATTSDALVALMSGADLNAASSKSAIGSNVAAAKSAYDKLGAGDLLLAWDDNADTEKAPRIHLLVVKSVDASGDKVTVMYPIYNQPIYTFQCKDCGKIDTEGPTSGACPDHVVSNSYYKFTRYKTHNLTDPTSSCEGTWKALYGTTWLTETVSFDALLGEGGQSVPYASVGYLPYTLAAYAKGETEPVKVTVTNATPAGDIAGGFKAHVTSNYRIVGFDAVLTGEDGSTRHFEELLPSWNTWEMDYSNELLDVALMECKTGKYSLTLNVKTGPANDPASKDGYVSAYTCDFNLAAAAVMLRTDKTVVIQGEDVTATLTVQTDGFTAIKATVSYDPKYFTFDAKKTTGSGVTFENDGAGTVSLRYAGGAVKSGATLAKLVFTCKRTGGFPVTEGVTPIKLITLSTSTTPGAKDSDLTSDRSDGIGNVTVGFNALVYKNYANGLDLVLVFIEDDSLVKKSTASIYYGDNLMYEVTQGNYSINKNRYFCTFGWLAENADATLVKKSTAEKPTNCPEISYSKDVNVSGVTDINDAQVIANIYNGKLPFEGNETKWFRADINRDGKVDAKDRDELFRSLMK